MNNRTIAIVAGVAVVLVVMLGMATLVGGFVVLRAAQASTMSPMAQLQEKAADLSDSLSSILPGRSGSAAQTGSASETAQAGETDGVLVSSVAADSPAAKAGIVRGDIILDVDGTAVNSVAELSAALSDKAADDQVTVTVRHGDDVRELDVTLAEQNGRTYLGIVPCGPGMGMMPQDHMTWNQAVLEGAVIAEIVDDGPAAAAGLEVGERIVSVDGKAVDAENTLPDLIGAFKPGDDVTLEVASGTDAETREVSVTLAEHPDKEGAGYLGVRVAPAMQFRMDGTDGEEMPFRFLLPDGQEGEDNPLPFTLPPGGMELPQELQDLLENGLPTEGVVVMQVEDDSPAATAGIATGDVITAIDSETIGDFPALREAIAGYAPGDEVTLTVTRQGEEEPQKIEVTLGENPADDTKAYLGISAFGMFHQFRGGEDGQMPGLPFDLQDLQELLPNLPFEQLPDLETPSDTQKDL